MIRHDLRYPAHIPRGLKVFQNTENRVNSWFSGQFNIDQKQPNYFRDSNYQSYGSTFVQQFENVENLQYQSLGKGFSVVLDGFPS